VQDCEIEGGVVVGDIEFSEEEEYVRESRRRGT
jgi:hypothetical protein